MEGAARIRQQHNQPPHKLAVFYNIDPYILRFETVHHSNSSSEEETHKMNAADNNLIQITVVSATNGDSHPMEISASSTVKEAMEWATMYLSMSGVKAEDYVFLKDGKPISNTAGSADSATPQSLEQAGVKHGDLLAVQRVQRRTIQPRQQPQVSGGAGLNFSSLFSR